MATAGLVAGMAAVALLLVDPWKIVGLMSVSSIGGALGSLASVLQRSGSLELESFAAPRYFSFQGSIRIVLGVLFAVSLTTLVLADLLLRGVGENPITIFAISILAGLNERLVPDMLVT